jgi:cytochrome b561
MVRALFLSAILSLACSPAWSQQAAAEPNAQFSNWMITSAGILVIMLFAMRAFDRPPVPIADVPTFPRYITSRMQYHLGRLVFAILSCGVFLLFVELHGELLRPLGLIPGLPLPKELLSALGDPSAPYLLVVGAMAVVYVYLLSKEAEWNVLLMMRGLIQRWISIPQLAARIVSQIRLLLRVPKEAIAQVIADSKGIVEQDFRKESNTPDRIWAGTCYMRWRLIQGHDSGEDVTFFSEESFAFSKLLEEFHGVSSDVVRWKSGSGDVDLSVAELPRKIRDLHNRISRLVACYLIYRNGSKQELQAAARNFGIDMSDPVTENPLRYWIIYAVALAASVYLGVCVSAIGYDLFNGKLDLAQDQNRTVAWIMYTFCNYGLAIFVILLLRLMTRLLQSDLNQSHLITYCWTFLVALVVGPFGLTIEYISLGRVTTGTCRSTIFTFICFDGAWDRLWYPFISLIISIDRYVTICPSSTTPPRRSSGA